MATVQGMCRNCGSLIMFDDREENCECIFCNCVFPSKEALEIMANPEGKEFANEKFEPTGETKHHHATRVFDDSDIEKAIKRDEAAKAKKQEVAAKNNEYEISPNDVKAPKKLVWGLIAGVSVAVIIIILIAWPLYNARINLTEKVRASVTNVWDGIATVDATEDEKGNSVGYSVFGQTCQSINILTEDKITESQALAMFDNYCSLRSSASDGKYDGSRGVTVSIFCDGGIYKVTQNGAVFQENVSSES